MNILTRDKQYVSENNKKPFRNNTIPFYMKYLSVCFLVDKKM